MPPQLLIDISRFDLGDHDQPDAYDVGGIEAINPHRGHMRMLDGITYTSEDFSEALAYKEVRDDAFWVEGHIPGRPVFPGVLMIEAAAQLASFCCLNRLQTTGHERFLGFVAAEDVKFRGQVLPGDRLWLLGREVKFSQRRFICEVQGVVGDRQVFQAKITGMPI